MAKEQWERQMELGYSDVPDKQVCAECITDYALKEFIRENADKNKCSYCSKESDEPIAIALAELVDYICECISTEWENPAESMAWEGREGGYQGASVYSGYELVTEQIEELFEMDNTEVLIDIACSSGDSLWCQIDPYGLRREEALTFSWEDFSNQVKHKTRYIFFRIDDEKRREYDIDMIPVSKILDRMSDELLMINEDIGVIKNLEANTKIFRARVHKKDEDLSTAKDFGTVPVEDAKYSNRMSPAGIPMFYGAFDPETASQEIVDGSKDKEGRIVSIATFNLLRIMMVLDLSNLPEIPSIFDKNLSHLRSSLIFLHGFVRELSKPINKDGFEHIEYVPTQAFTEYIRHLFKTFNDASIEGILYPSSRHAGGISCVLFIENDQCCDKVDERDEKAEKEPIKYLLFENIESRPL